MSPAKLGASTQFGLCVPIFAHPGGSFFRTPSWTALEPRAAVDVALLAERLGYDSLWVADHLIHGSDGGILEGWSTLAFLAGRTSRIRLGTIHLAHLFRAPGLTAKMAATLDALSGGRLIFFYDLGGGSRECDAYGFEVPPLAERVARMDEGLSLIRRLWTSDEPVTFEGRYYRTNQAICIPGPAQKPAPPIWLGEVREDPWCEVVCKHATGWNSTPVSVDGYAAKLAKLEATGRSVGRSLNSFELSLEIEVLVRSDRASVRQVVDHIAALPPAGPVAPRADLLSYLGSSDPARDLYLPSAYEERVLIGTPDEVVDRIRQYRSLGVRHFMLWFLDFPSTLGIELFAEKVIPAIR